MIHSWSEHYAAFDLREYSEKNSPFMITGPEFVTVALHEFVVKWENRNQGEGWKLKKVDITGPRLLVSGRLGKPATITVFDLNRFPPGVIDEINKKVPKS
ncbi:hypothetical protein ACWDYH_00325 [Nocardia goodfellowii]